MKAGVPWECNWYHVISEQDAHLALSDSICEPWLHHAFQSIFQTFQLPLHISKCWHLLMSHQVEMMFSQLMIAF
jgi:hypothetical protein